MRELGKRDKNGINKDDLTADIRAAAGGQGKKGMDHIPGLGLLLFVQRRAKMVWEHILQGLIIRQGGKALAQSMAIRSAH